MRSGTPGLVPAVTEQLERSHSVFVTAHHLAIDQARPHFEVVHGLDQERVALRPVVAPAGDQPDANRIAPGHEPEAVVLDLVNPVGAGGELDLPAPTAPGAETLAMTTIRFAKQAERAPGTAQCRVSAAAPRS
jgi:hypothetical protein